MKDGISITIAVPLVNSSLSFFLSFFVSWGGRIISIAIVFVIDVGRERRQVGRKGNEGAGGSYVEKMKSLSSWNNGVRRARQEAYMSYFR